MKLLKEKITTVDDPDQKKMLEEILSELEAL